MGLKERREREKLERKKQILDAARTLLLDKGLQATSINRIAKVAELGVATLYSYYKNKEDIYVAHQEEGLSLLYTKIKEAARKGKTSSDKIKRMALAYYRFSEVQKDYFDVIHYFLTAPKVIFSQDKKTLVDLLGDKILTELKAAIDEGGQEGVYQKVNTTRSALVFWATLNGLIQFKKMKTTLLQGESHKVLYTFAVEQFIQGLTQRRV